MAFSQVPNTTTFTLKNVVDVVIPTTDDLVDSFTDSNADYFDATYGSKTMNPKTLLGFRNYGGTCPEIGDTLNGGIVVYLFVSGDPGYVSGECHGLISSFSDLSTGDSWSTTNTDVYGADATALYTGYDNTWEIIDGLSSDAHAATICTSYGAEYEWFLPSKNELDKILHGLVISVGGVADDSYYWTSSEYATNYAWSEKYRSSDGAYIQVTSSKTGNARIRACKYF